MRGNTASAITATILALAVIGAGATHAESLDPLPSPVTAASATDAGLLSAIDLKITQALIHGLSATGDGMSAEVPPNDRLGTKLYRMFRESGSGYWQEERAAWIGEDSTGLVLFRWRFSAQRQAASWRGLPPSVAVAQVHTHPNSESSRPSVSGANSDYAFAQRFQLPVYVVSRDGVWRVAPGPLIRGRNPAPVAGKGWWKVFARKET